MQNFTELKLEKGTQEKLIYRKDEKIDSGEAALLIIKPSNNIINANSTETNVKSIISRFEKRGWILTALKLIAGSEANIERLIAHYPKPFFDGETEDIRFQLTAAEKERLNNIWGEEAGSYPIYHPIQIIKKGMGNYQTIAKVWHAGRGTDNQLIDVGDPNSINTISPQKDPDYGKRHLLLIKDNPAFPGAKPFFMLNGFTAELIVKFSRGGEKIIVMAFAQETLSYDLNYIREHIVGITSPHHAKPGSIRYDALHSDEETNDHPITSADIVGIENNIVHLSENSAEAYRELQLWLPEVL